MNMARSSGVEQEIRNILIIDAYPVVRKGLAEFINQQKRFRVCGELENAYHGLKTIDVLKPDIVILEVSYKGLIGLDLIKMIKTNHPWLPILVFSIFRESFYAERALQMGAKGYIMKHEPLDKIVEAVNKVLLGEIYLSDKLAAKVMQKTLYNQSASCHSAIDLLSDRELEIFRLIGQGYSTRGMAEKLCLSLRTIETYRGRIKYKLNLKSRESLLKQAIQWVRNETKIC